MGKIINLEDFLKRKNLWKELYNKIVIYPTDTVYGIGCNAYKEDLVEKIYEIKRRDKNKPVSVILPDFSWIEKYFEINSHIEKELKEKLPGPYTFVLKKKNKEFLPHVSDEYLGVRIIDHPIQHVIEELNIPFVTTSANISGEGARKKVEEIEEEIKNKADLIIDGGELRGIPSTIIDYRGERKIIKRKS